MSPVTDMLPNVNILVVEDDAFTRKLLSAMMESLGLRPVFAENGAEGLDMCRRLSPDIVLSDYNMPQMNGLDMFRVISREQPDVKLVLMTIYTEPDVLIKAINLGVDRFLEKPVNKERLKAVLEKMTDDVITAKDLKKFQNLLNSYRYGVDSSTIFSLLDKDGCFTYVNEKFCEISGYSESELVGSSDSILRKEAYARVSELAKVIDQRSEKIWQGCIVNVSKEGREYVTELNLLPVYDEWGVTGFISIEMDMDFIVSSHLSQLQAFFNADTSILFAFDNGMNMKLCNDSFLSFFGYGTRKDAVDANFCLTNYLVKRENDPDIGKEHTDFKHMVVENKLDIKKVTLKKDNDPNEYVFTLQKFVLKQSYLGFDDMTVIRLNDITELETLKREEVASTMLASIGKLAAGITHEINTPLTYIKGYTEILQSEVEENVSASAMSDMQDYFTSINEGIGRISSIIESMKEVTGEASVEKAPVNLYATLVSAGRMVYNRAKHISNIYINGVQLDMNTKSDSEVYMTSGVQQMLVQVWIILLNNCLDQLSINDLTFDKKYIKISIESIINGKHRISIADSGGGIDEKILNRIFDLFSSTKKHKGMGIGLNIAKSIIDKHGGTITPFNSGDGAVFEIVL